MLCVICNNKKVESIRDKESRKRTFINNSKAFTKKYINENIPIKMIRNEKGILLVTNKGTELIVKFDSKNSF